MVMISRQCERDIILDIMLYNKDNAYLLEKNCAVLSFVGDVVALSLIKATPPKSATEVIPESVNIVHNS